MSRKAVVDETCLAEVLRLHKLWASGEPGSRANLEGADLRWANLEGADLRGADLRGADLRWANLRGTNLEGANLEGTCPEWANLRGTNLRGASLEWANLRGTNLRGASLEEANLGGTNLEGADLRGANLRWANLRGANLEGADLRGADLRWANLEWSSHDLIAHVLFLASGNDIERRKTAGLVLVSRDWCWPKFRALANTDSSVAWAFDHLALIAKEDEEIPQELREWKARGEDVPRGT